jgi:hypothetical protein
MQVPAPVTAAFAALPDLDGDTTLVLAIAVGTTKTPAESDPSAAVTASLGYVHTAGCLPEHIGAIFGTEEEPTTLSADQITSFLPTDPPADPGDGA